MKLGIFSVSFPEYTPMQALDILSDIGFDGIEWRITTDDGDREKPSFWSGNRCGLTATELIQAATDLKEKGLELGMEFPSLGAYIDSSDLEAVELHFKAAVALGSKNIRIGSGRYPNNEKPYPECVKEVKKQYAAVAELAQQYGVRAVIETHMGQNAPSITKALNILHGLDPKFVGIMWDPANQVYEGRENFQMAIEEAGEYLAEVHAKNMAYVKGEVKDGQQTWNCNAVPMKEGIVNWPEVIQILKKNGYDGWIFFEDFSTEKPLLEKTRENYAWFRELIG